jgi:hypothetical protein
MQSSAEAPARGEQRSDQEPFSGNAMEWVLRKADESLDEIEDNPPEYVKTIYEVSNGPIGELPALLEAASLLAQRPACKAAGVHSSWKQCADGRTVQGPVERRRAQYCCCAARWVQRPYELYEDEVSFI